MRLKGRLESGFGRFSKQLTTIPLLLEAYQRKTEMSLFPGTLNVRLTEAYSMPPGALRLEKEEYFGQVSIRIVPCTILGRRGFIVRTDNIEYGVGIHPKNVIEVISNVAFRNEFGLEDGNAIEIFVE